MRLQLTLSDLAVAMVIAVACLALCSPKLRATILHVPADYGTVQGGIDAAVDGDTILVAPGTYYENISFKRKDIVVSSRFMLDMDPAFIKNTILNGATPSLPDSASVVRITGVGDSTTILQGFTITGGKGTKWPDAHPSGIYREGGGILIDTASPTIQYNLIINNQATNAVGVASAGGGGIRAGDASAIIRNNLILNNKGRYGGGIVLNYPTGGRISNNVIAGNSGGEDYGGGGIWINAGANIPILYNTVVNNSSVTVNGGGLRNHVSSPLTIKNSIFWGNTAPGESQITSVGYSIVSYCDVQGGFVGTGNVNADPVLYGAYLYHMPTSPCIDAGDPASPLYDDIENPLAPGSAKWPSHGTLGSDIGAYGGPDAFSFEKIVTVLHNNGVSVVPCTAYVEAYTSETFPGLHWDFGDGIPDYNPTTSHVFPAWGGYPISLKGDTGLGTLSILAQDTAYALADSMIASHKEASAGQPVEVEIYGRNAPPLYSMTVPIEWSGDLELQFDSVSRSGCRNDFFNVMAFSSFDLGAKHIAIRLQNTNSGAGAELGTGAGPVLRFWFTIPPTATLGQTAVISLDGYDSFQPVCKSLILYGPSNLTYRPADVSGSITVISCCQSRGDVNYDSLHKRNILDVTYLVAYLFQGGVEPPCNESADVNGDASVNVVDITYMVQYLFRYGSQPPPCP